MQAGRDHPLTPLLLLGGLDRPCDVVHGAGAGDAAPIALLEDDPSAAMLAARQPVVLGRLGEAERLAEQQLAAGRIGDERLDALEAL